MIPKGALPQGTRPSPLRNKVNPEGDIEAVSTREATLMGNRGVLHDDGFHLTRTAVKGKPWIYSIARWSMESGSPGR